MVEQQRSVTKLQAAIRIPTSAHPDHYDPQAFADLHAQLRQDFPLLHEHLELTQVGTHGLLFHWAGRSADRPVVLMAHQDVVPVEGEWQHPGFSGEIADGEIWGRGTLDDKGSLIAICEAVELHLEQGFVPAQDIWLSFGGDEEVLGSDAVAAVAEFERRGVRPWLVIDEGGAIAHDAFPGVDRPLGVIGVSEKGTAHVELTVEDRGGHASMPSKWGPTSRLARAIVRIEKHPMAARVPGPTLEMVERLSAHTNALLRPLMANASRLTPVIDRALVAAGPESAAMVRTTITTTTLQGSPANNVIASRATAGLNIRIMVGETISQVLDHLRRVIRDKQVQLELISGSEPSPVSPYTNDPGFDLITSTIEEVFPDAIHTPYVLMGATDSRFFTSICERVYRFTPFRMSKQQREAIHSYDERIGVTDFVNGVEWYHRFLARVGA
ncbi:MAG TPA: M20/M25/M40 family metallo-hydrolase [Marmoricola sp.]|nr:M20/M25/M40 family metallo-hydrolase [Marmoricola sp.]